MQELSQITLDTILKELYARDSGKTDRKQVAIVLDAANSEIASTSKFARNTKYLYQNSTFSTTLLFISLEQKKNIQCLIAVKYLLLVLQYNAFAADKISVILFNLDNLEENTVYSKQEIEKTICSLTTLQKSILFFFSDSKEISIEETGADVLAVKIEFDQLEEFSLAINLDTHYFFNSKTALFISGLPRYILIS